MFLFWIHRVAVFGRNVDVTTGWQTFGEYFICQKSPLINFQHTNDDLSMIGTLILIVITISCMPNTVEYLAVWQNVFLYETQTRHQGVANNWSLINYYKPHFIYRNKTWQVHHWKLMHQWIGTYYVYNIRKPEQLHFLSMMYA